MSYEPRAWKCEQCGAILGIVRRENSRRPKLDVLRIQEWSCKTVAEIAGNSDPDYFAIVGVEVGTVRCQRCGAERTWHMGEQAIEDLLESRKKRLEVA